MNEQASQYEETADDHRLRGEFVEAGDTYTTAAYAYLATHLPKTAKGFCDPGFCLLEAAVCYRLGGQMNRCVNRCEQGILLAEDVLDRVDAREPPKCAFDRARRAALYEFIGNFRIIGGLDGAAEAYDEAINIYETEDNPITAYIEQEHMSLLGFLELLSKGVDADGELGAKWWNEARLTEWVSYERNRLPILLSELDKQGEWRWKDD